MYLRPLLFTLLSTLAPQLGLAVTTPLDPQLTSKAHVYASNQGANDYFGQAVAISGDTMVVGAPFEDSSTTGADGSGSDNSAANSGAVYVYVRNGTGWTQQAYLKASNTGAGDQFGFSVAISGDTIVVGAFAEASKSTGVDGVETDNTAVNAGAAYVFVRDGTTWTQEAYLKASNAEAGDLFGYSVGISGETIVVGAFGESSALSTSESDNTLSQAGAAYVFTRNGSVWTQEKYLKASNPGRSDFFGIAVGISGDRIVVGASGEASASAISQTDNSATNAGAAYAFSRSGSSWKQDGYLKGDNIGAEDLFGRAVAISGTSIVVGAYQEDSSTTGVNSTPNNSSATSGAAYVFTRGTSQWTQQAYLKASDTAAGDAFGYAVAIEDNTVVIGANGKTSKTGSAYVFVRYANAWNPSSKLVGAGPVSDVADNFGASVAISAATGVVGAFGDAGLTNALTLSGGAYVFTGLEPQIPEIVVKNGSGTVLTNGATVNFSAFSTAKDAEQLFTIQNGGVTDLTGILVEETAGSDPTNQFAIDLTGTATTLAPTKFTTFKIAMSGTGYPTATLTIKSDDPNFPTITLKLVGKAFSETADTDGDGLSDYAEYQLRSLGFDPEVKQLDLVKTLKDNASYAGLYDTNSALNLPTPTITKGADGNFTLTIGVQRSFDLKTFTAFPMSDSQIFVDSLGKLQFRFPSLRTQAFYRLQAQ